jgi:hypothetical protein
MLQIKNITEEDIIVNYIKIDAGQTYDVPFNDELSWANNNEVIQYISNNSLKIIKNGTEYNTIVEQLSALQGTLVKLDESRDSDGVPLQRLKIAANGAKFKTHHIYFKTSDLDSLKERKEDGTSYDYSTLKLFDINGIEITDSANEGDAVKTVVEFEPPFTYEIIGGGIYQASVPASSLIVHAIFAPTIPEAYGGQIHFINEGHLEMMGTGKVVDIDGYVPKKINYDSVNHSGRFNFVFHHAAGLQHELLMFIKIFVP